MINRAIIARFCFLSLAVAAFLFVPLPTYAAGTATVFSNNQQLWDASSDVQLLQQFLNANGFIVSLTGAGSPGHETTTFGLHTYHALVQFQNAHGLLATGFFGPLTRADINSGGATSNSSQNTPSTNATTASTTPPFSTPLPGYAPGQLIFGGGSSPTSSPAPVSASDTTAPSVSLTAPSNGATVSGSSVTLTATASDNVAVASVQFKVDSTNIGSAITASPYTATWNSTGVADGSHTLYAVAVDTSGNYATSSISITVRNSPPVISAISSGSPTTTAATITWTTDEAASSKVVYGATSAYGSATSSPSLVTSHSIGVIGLTASTTYHYAVVSTDVVGNTATSTDQTFTTANTGPDVTPPTAPTNLTAGASSSSELDLSWNASTDNVGVAGYKIFRGGSQVGTTTSATTYADTGLTSSTTYTYFVKAYDAAGNISSASNIATSTTGTWSDGFANAPSGTPQFSTLLQGYATRAPWRVAGVDYPVGITSGTVLKDPAPGGVLAAGLTALGGTANFSNHVITFSGINNIVINGWDFSLEGSWTVEIQGNNATIENSNFQVGTTLRPPVIVDNLANGVTIIDNVIDGAAANTNPAGGMLVLNAQGTTTIEYNFIKNAYYQFVEAGPSSSGTTTEQLIEYNVLQNGGYGSPNGAHGDWVQDIGTSGQIFQNIQINFNTVVQNDATADWSTQGFSILSAASQSASALNEGLSNNTIVLPFTPLAERNVNYSLIVDNTWLNGHAVVGNNYIDPTGITGSWLFAGQFNGTDGPFNGTVLTGGNTNMVTAQLFSGQSPLSVSITAPTASSTVGGTLVNLSASASDSINAISNVQFKVDGTNIGSAVTTSPYSIAWNSNGVADGSHTIAAVAHDAAGNYATSSISVTVRNSPPVISSISSGTPTTTAATITWTTDENASSKVVYGATSGYGSASSSASLVTSHSIGVIGLTPSTLYHYAVVSADVSGNTSTSTDQTFTTAASGSSYVGPGDISPSAAAWFGLRAYNAAYATGLNPAADICDAATGATCTTINILSNGNFDTATAQTFCTAHTSCVVSKLYDQTGNGNNLTQATNADRPTLTFNCTNSLPCLTFSGVTAAQLGIAASPSIAVPWSVSAVAERTGSFTSFQGIFTGYTGSQEVGLFFQNSANAGDLETGLGSIPSASAPDSAFHALEGVAGASTIAIYADGTPNLAAASSAAWTNTNVMEVGNSPFNNVGMTGNWEESGVWSNLGFSTSTATSLNSNQHTYWGF